MGQRLTSYLGWAIKIGSALNVRESITWKFVITCVYLFIRVLILGIKIWFEIRIVSKRKNKQKKQTNAHDNYIKNIQYLLPTFHHSGVIFWFECDTRR